ncbi:MAG: sulfatase-like hydrolase/transferase [Crocinitomicaceae bacterium]
MLIFTLCRVIFFIHNNNYFPEAGFLEFLSGMWFDLIAVCLLFYPLIAVELFPNKNRTSKWYRITTAILTYLAFTVGIFVNLIDIEYFHHTTTRSNISLFKMLRFGEDLKQQIPSFIGNYWYILLFFLIFLILTVLVLKRFNSWTDDSPKISIRKQLIIYLLVIASTVIIGRGGFIRKPITPTQAAKFTTSQNVPLVLNTAFTMINSIGAATIEEKNYFSEEELKNRYNPLQQYPSGGKVKGQNVVLILIESFTPEYIGAYHPQEEKSYTPFFDSLANQSLFFTNAFANGKKSLDAVPAVVASIPKLMETEYLLSPYAANEIDALPEHLGKIGYSSAFFHGATNGSMNFDAFSELAEFDNYFGRSEYNNDTHYDGTWGIYDHHFLSWSIDKMNEMKRPFFSTIFTISNHPPYSIPPELEEKFEYTPSEQHKTIMYTDYALQLFFEKAAEQNWYANTLFIITADHTPGTKQSQYSHSIGRLRIPLLFYHPLDTFFRGRSDKIAGQTDLMPTLLDLSGYQTPFISFGNSLFSHKAGLTAAQIGGEFIVFKTVQGVPYALTYRNEKAIGLYQLEDVNMKNNLLSEKQTIGKQLEQQLKAMIQVYNKKLIHNALTVDTSK